MNPIRLWKAYLKVRKIKGIIQEVKVSKSLFKSKMFWVNLLTAIADLLGVLPIPFATTILAVINIILRRITNQAVHVLPPEN